MGGINVSARQERELGGAASPESLFFTVQSVMTSTNVVFGTRGGGAVRSLVLLSMRCISRHPRGVSTAQGRVARREKLRERCECGGRDENKRGDFQSFPLFLCMCAGLTPK